jgi:hypothetical protein
MEQRRANDTYLADGRYRDIDANIIILVRHCSSGFSPMAKRCSLQEGKMPLEERISDMMHRRQLYTIFIFNIIQ